MGVKKSYKRRLRFSEIALLAFVFFIPLEDFFLQDVLGSSTRIAGGAMILIYLLAEPAIKWQYAPTGFYLYFAWAIISILVWANIPDYYSIFRLFMWMLTTLVAANIIARNTDLIPRIFRVYIVSTLYLAYVAIRDFIGGASTGLNRVDVEGINQNLLASQFLICIIYLLYNYFRSENKPFVKSISIGLIILFLLATIASGSRSAMLTIAIAFLLILPKKSVKFSTIMQAGFLVILVGYFLFNTDNVFARFLYTRVEATQTDYGANRLIIWKVAQNMVIDNPVIGVGYRNFPSEFNHYLQQTSLDMAEWQQIGNQTRRGTHNAILETLSELGIIGFLFFYGFQFKLMRRLNLHKGKYDLLAIILLIAINFNALFGDLANLKYFWLIVGICMGIMMKHKLDNLETRTSLAYQSDYSN